MEPARTTEGASPPAPPVDWILEVFLLACALIAGALWIPIGWYEREPGMIAVGAPYLVAIAWYVSNRLRGRPRGRRLVPALLAVFGACSGVALFHFAARAPEARRQTARVELLALGYCADGFRADAGRWPINMDEVCACYRESPRVCRGGAPLDPWKTPYVYEPPGPGHPDTWVLRSLGRDRAPGGDAEDADVVVDRDSGTLR